MVDCRRKRELTNQMLRECAGHFALKEQKRLYGNQREYCGVNWFTNLYLIYTNDYITFSTFFELEMQDIVLSDITTDEEEFRWCENVLLKMLGTFMSLGTFCGGKTHEEIGSLLTQFVNVY